MLECEQKFGSDPEFTFWRAYSLTMQSEWLTIVAPIITPLASFFEIICQLNHLLQDDSAGTNACSDDVYTVSIVVDVIDSISEAMRELESIQDKRDTMLCSTMLLVYAHKKCKSVGVSVIFIFIFVYLFV